MLTSLGLASIPFVRGDATILIQAMTGLSLIGQLAAYRQRRVIGPLLVSVVSSMLVAFAYYASYHVALIYFGLTGLVDGKTTVPLNGNTLGVPLDSSESMPYALRQ